MTHDIDRPAPCGERKCPPPRYGLRAPNHQPGDRVTDKEGNSGTVLREENGRIIVDGDAGTCEWNYRPDELYEEADDE